MTIRKIYIFFGLLLSCFCTFADSPYCDASCEQLKAYCYSSIDASTNNLAWISSDASIANFVYLDNLRSPHDSSLNTNQKNAIINISNSLMAIQEMATSSRENLVILRSFVDSVDCSSSNFVNSVVDLTVVTNILDAVNGGFSQVAGGMTNIVSFLGSFSGQFGSDLAGSLDYMNDTIDWIYNYIENYDRYIVGMYNILYEFNSIFVRQPYNGSNTTSIRTFDPWIFQELQNISSNFLNGSSADFSFTNRLNYSSLLGWDRFQSYLQAQRADQTVSWYPVSPYNSQQNLQNATLYDALAAGFENTLISLGSLNNYFYWIKNHMPSNSFDDTKILASLGVLSNTLNRIDGYVVQDFSNEFYRLSQYLITNSVISSPSSFESNYFHTVTGSLFTIRDLLDTNNLYLASIETSVTNIDFSVGRFRDYLLGSQNSISDYDGSEDSSYYDFLTNKYIVGTSDDGVSSNWFERIETLLAALVFSTDSNTNIVSSGSFEGIDENEVRSTLDRISFEREFTDMSDSVGSVQRSFTGILTSLHSSVKNVTKPQSISIGFTDNGTTTTDFNGLLEGDFEVSVSVGEFGSFTEVVRAVTTMIIVLVTLIMIYKTCFFLIRNAYRLYSFGRTLVTSIFFR